MHLRHRLSLHSGRAGPSSSRHRGTSAPPSAAAGSILRRLGPTATVDTRHLHMTSSHSARLGWSSSRHPKTSVPALTGGGSTTPARRYSQPVEKALQQRRPGACGVDLVKVVTMTEKNLSSRRSPLRVRTLKPEAP